MKRYEILVPEGTPVGEGYLPLGGICANKDTYSQAMIKYSQEE